MKIKIIKLGGAIITNNEPKEKLDRSNTRNIARQLQEYYPGTILVHGTGSVGKPPAIRYGFVESGSLGPDMKFIALKIKNQIHQLNQQFISVFISEGIPVQSIVHWQLMGSRLYVSKSKILEILQSGLVPVFFGDFVIQKDGSFKVVSSDVICHLVTKLVKPEKLIFLTDVDGVFDDGLPPKLIPEINRNNYASIPGDHDHKDVSGGMAEKVKLAIKSSKYCKTCLIANGTTPGLLYEALQGHKVRGTYVYSKD